MHHLQDVCFYEMVVQGLLVWPMALLAFLELRQFVQGASCWSGLGFECSVAAKHNHVILLCLLLRRQSCYRSLSVAWQWH